MTAENSTNFAALLKEYYTEKKVENMVLSESPLLAMLPKNEEIQGSDWHIPLVTSDAGGSSSQLSTAISTSRGVTASKFVLSMKSEYAVAYISRQVMKESRSNVGAFLPAVKTNIDGAIRKARRMVGVHLYTTSSALGQIGSVTSANPMVITLSDIRDVVRFHVGMKLECDDALSATGGTANATPASVTITAINMKTGKLTTDHDNSGGGSDWSANDYLFRYGDWITTSGHAYLRTISGLPMWVPVSDPSSSSFFGVDRTSDIVALSGVRYDGSAQNVYEALIDGISTVAHLGGGRVDHVFLNDAQHRILTKELVGKTTLQEFRVNQDISFSGFTLNGPSGSVRVLSDRYCPTNYAQLLTLDTWELGSLGKAIDIFDRDNDQEMLRNSTEDAYEVRIGGYMNLGCHAPGHNGVVTLAAP